LLAGIPMSSSDIYNPRPMPVSVGPPAAEPVQWNAGDLGALIVLGLPVYVAVGWAWSIDHTLGLWVSIAGVFMILESWFSALTFLHRHRETSLTPGRRWLVFLAALLPWLITLGLGVVLMLGLFSLSDWLRR
jgi:hypothetical protein